MSKIKESYNKYKSEVIVSVITTFICFLGKSLFNYLKDTGIKFIDVFGNYIYYEMSRIDDFYLIQYILCFILGVLLAWFLLMCILFFLRIFKKKDEDGKKIDNKKKSIPLNPKFRLFIKITYFLDILFLIVFTFGIMYCLNCKHEFDLKMTALKPYISAEKYDMLYSEWVTMYSKDDFDKIQNQLLKLRCEFLIDDKNIKNIVCK